MKKKKKKEDSLLQTVFVIMSRMTPKYFISELKSGARPAVVNRD